MKIQEVAEIVGVEEVVITHFIEAGWILPVSPEDQELDEEDIARIRLIHDLQELLNANDDTIPVILHLLDQIHQLRLMIKKAA